MAKKLTPAEVRAIRTEGRTDGYWAVKLKHPRGVIRNARVGITYKRSRTPADTAPRLHRGNW